MFDDKVESAPTSFVCATNDDFSSHQKRVLIMKPRVGVYLSEPMAARLTDAAKRPGATKSALVEYALDHFLGSENDMGDSAMMARHLAGISNQIAQLDRDLKIVAETVALHARFHLATTPPMPGVALRSTCALGAERFEEFAAQVRRHIDRGSPLMRETIERVAAATPRSEEAPQDGWPPCVKLTGDEQGFGPSTHEVSAHTAAGREDGSHGGFRGCPGRTLH